MTTEIKTWRDNNGDLLTDEDPYDNPNWTRLVAGDIIRTGYLFNRKLDSKENNPYTIIEERTTVCNKILNGMMWLNCYPLVYRRVK